jgi:glutathione S-transferase
VTQARLYTLSPSHFCERARWGLDHAQIPFEEVRWAVGLHVPLAKRLAPATSLPILDTGSAVIQGSGTVLDWTGLAGGDPDLEGRFEQRIGPLVRRYIYSATLHNRRSGIRELLLDGVPATQKVLGTLMWPVTRRLMRAGMNTRPELVPRLERELEAELDWFEARLGSRDHLDGDGLGRADITAASLLAPLARPEACPLYRRARLPSAVEATVRRWSERPSMRWVMQTYAEHRNRRAVHKLPSRTCIHTGAT